MAKRREDLTKTRLWIGLAAIILAVVAFALDQLERRYLSGGVAPQTYIFVIAAVCTVLGVYAGVRWARRPAPAPYRRNDAAIAALGLSARELDVLALAAEGAANKEIARTLGLSPNTVKTHLSHLYEKLEVNRRTQAIEKARRLQLIP